MSSSKFPPGSGVYHGPEMVIILKSEYDALRKAAPKESTDNASQALCGAYLGDNDGTCPQLTCIRNKGHDGDHDNVRGDAALRPSQATIGTTEHGDQVYVSDRDLRREIARIAATADASVGWCQGDGGCEAASTSCNNCHRVVRRQDAADSSRHDTSGGPGSPRRSACDQDGAIPSPPTFSAGALAERHGYEHRDCNPYGPTALAALTELLRKVRVDAILECAAIAVREQAYWKERGADGQFAAENIEGLIRKLSTQKGGHGG